MGEAMNIALKDTMIESQLVLGDACLERREYAKAVEAYEKGVKLLDGKSIRAAMLDRLYSGLLWSYLESGRREEAERVYESAGLERGLEARVLVDIALMYLRAGKREKALEVSEKAIREKDRGYYCLGQIRMGDGEPAKAREAFVKALERGEFELESRIGMSELYREGGKYEEAQKELDKALGYAKGKRKDKIEVVNIEKFRVYMEKFRRHDSAEIVMAEKIYEEIKDKEALRERLEATIGRQDKTIVKHIMEYMAQERMDCPLYEHSKEEMGKYTGVHVREHVGAGDDIFHKNKTLNEQEIRLRKLVLKSKPTYLGVELTKKCNLGCEMCFQRGTDRTQEVSESTVCQVEELMPYLETISWLGGEAFLYEGFEKLYKKAAAYKNLTQVIVTNGQLIDERWAELLTGTSLELIFSIDGTTKGTYEGIRRGASFEKLKENIGLINKYRMNSGSAVKTGITFIVMSSNYRELENLPEFAAENGFNFVNLTTLLNFDHPQNIFYSCDKDAIEAVSKMKPLMLEKADKFGVKFNYWLNSPEHYDFCDHKCAKGNVKAFSLCTKAAGADGILFCHNPWTKMYVVTDEVSSFCLCKKPIGNLKENTLLEIWNGETAQLYRRNMIENNLSMCDYRCMLFPGARLDGRFARVDKDNG